MTTNEYFSTLQRDVNKFIPHVPRLVTKEEIEQHNHLDVDTVLSSDALSLSDAELFDGKSVSATTVTHEYRSRYNAHKNKQLLPVVGKYFRSLKF